MNATIETGTRLDRKILLSTLWIFATVNYIFCDVVSSMETETLRGFMAGQIGNLHITQGFLLGASIMMEIPFAMILCARILSYRINRWANISAGVIMSAIQIASLFAGTAPTLHYIFFSAVEIASTLSIVWFAWSWVRPEASLSHQ